VPKPLPDIGSRYVIHVNETLKIVSSTEALWLTAKPTSVIRQQLKVDRLEALYEAAFLRVFSAWEDFVEESLTYLLAGYRTPTYTPLPAPGTKLAGTLKAARSALYGSRSYLLWHDPDRVINRAKRHVVSCPVENVFLAERLTLGHYAAVRHRIAHSSVDAAHKFRNAAVYIAGSEYKGLPGRFLRSPDLSDPLNQPKWIRVICDELSELAIQITQ
jgi:hypothetical protein